MWTTLASPASLVAQGDKTVVFTNRTVWDRLGWGTVTVPFNQGEWRGHNSAFIKEFGGSGSALNRYVYLRPFGLPYPDGSYRYGELMTPVYIQKGTGSGITPGMADKFQQVRYTVALGSSKPAPKPMWGPNIRTLQRLRLPLELTVGISPTLTTGSVTFDLLGSKSTAEYSVETVVHGPRLSRRYLSRSGDFVIDLWVHHYAAEDHFVWELRVTNSGHAGVHGAGRTGTNLYTQVEPHVALATKATAIPSVYGAGQRRSSPYVKFNFDRVMALRIAHPKGKWGDGQSQIWRGVLSVPMLTGDDGRSMPSHVHPLVGASADWTATTAYGPHGFVPMTGVVRPGAEPAKKFLNYWRYLNTRPAKDEFWEILSHESYPVGLHKDAGATSVQPDFGLIEGWDAMAVPSPELAEIYGYLAYGCARRPYHHYVHRSQKRGPDGVLRLTETTAPSGYLVRDGLVDRVNSTHFLGKGDTAKSSKGTYKSKANPHETNKWTGFKKSHLSINLLYTGYILNPWSRMLEDELDFLAEAFLLDCLDPSKHCSWKSKYGQARALGRSMFAMSQVYLAKGRSRDDVMKRMNARTTHGIKVVPRVPNTCKTKGRESLRPTRQVRAMVVQSTNLPAWGCPPAHPATIVPWEEMLAVAGLSAAFMVSGSMTGTGAQAPHADHLAVAKTVALSMMEHGYKVSKVKSQPPILVAYRYKYPKDGKPHPPSIDCGPVVWGGGGLTTWTAPAAYLVVHYFANKNTVAYRNAALLLRQVSQSKSWTHPWHRWRWSQ